MELDQLIEAIQRINKKFTDGDWVKAQNGNVLSYTALKLAAMKAYLIDVKEIAHAETLEAEIEMDRQKAIAYKKALKESNATAAKDGKYDDEDFIAARRAYAAAKVQFEKLKSVTADSHDLIESIRSRVIDLQGARKDEQVR